MRFVLPCCVVAGLSVLAGLSRGEEATADSAEVKETRRLIDAELPRWSFQVGPGKREVKLEPKSLLRWSNPGTGRVFGDLYVATDEGRPMVVMSLFYAWQPANGFHVELHSLTAGELTGRRAGAVTWSPSRPGMVLKGVPGSEKPAGTAVARLAQMKGMAREFSVVLEDRRVSDAGEEQALRLLSQPLYRYPAGVPGAVDGGLFAFALGTDPEIFVLLEGRETEWQYGLVRMNDGVLTVLYRGKEAQRFERAAERDHEHDPYVLKRITP